MLLPHDGHGYTNIPHGNKDVTFAGSTKVSLAHSGQFQKLLPLPLLGMGTRLDSCHACVRTIPPHGIGEIIHPVLDLENPERVLVFVERTRARAETNAWRAPLADAPGMLSQFSATPAQWAHQIR